METATRTHGCLDCHTTFQATPTGDFASCPHCGAHAGVQIVPDAAITATEDGIEEGEHEECLGIHNSADGYRDCDGNPF